MITEDEIDKSIINKKIGAYKIIVNLKGSKGNEKQLFQLKDTHQHAWIIFGDQVEYQPNFKNFFNSGF